MSFLDKLQLHIKGIQDLPENAALSHCLTEKGLSKSNLGHFEPLLQRLSLIQGKFPLEKLKPSILSFVADHGVAKSLVTTHEEFSDSHASILHILSKPNYYFFQAQEKTLLGHRIVDLGAFQSDENNSTFWLHRGQGLINARINSGSANFAEYPAMTTAECEEAFAIGQKLVEREAYGGVNFLFLNSFGKGEDISFFALLAALKDKSFSELWEHSLLPELEKNAIEDLSKAIRRHPISHDPFTILSFFGSFETAALCGAILKGAEQGIALILNSSMAKIAALITQRINPKAIDYCLYAHPGFFESERQQFGLDSAIPHLSMSAYKIPEPYYLAGEMQVLQALLEELTIS